MRWNIFEFGSHWVKSTHDFNDKKFIINSSSSNFPSCDACRLNHLYLALNIYCNVRCYQCIQFKFIRLNALLEIQ